MRIRVLGGGWYGCHIASAMLADGHDVELHEIKDKLFAGASGANPARLHLGFHYPRSRLTRAACQEHQAEFLRVYGDVTRTIPVNVYAVAAHDSLVDFGTYKQVLQGEVPFIPVHAPSELGLRNVEGALLTGERHVVIREVAALFEQRLRPCVHYGESTQLVDDPSWDWTIDCTFCANDSEAIDRFEPCVVGLLRGRTDVAITIMDGPFPSLYPWDEQLGLCSLTSAKWTPLSKECRTYEQAASVLSKTSPEVLQERVDRMIEDVAGFYPEARDYVFAGVRTGIRAMPRSASDARLVDVIRVGEKALRVRAGKIDAVFHAERLVREMMR